MILLQINKENFEMIAKSLCKIVKIMPVITQLWRNLFKSKRDFTDEIDENQGLPCFDNNVYDLNEMVFRDGRPDDMLSIFTWYDFCL